MLARVRSLTLLGVEAIPLTVECDIARGLPGIHTVGLPDAAVRESADRVRVALRNSGYEIPPRRITISLAPADLKKEGSALDLPIALGILVAAGQAPAARLPGFLVAGEVGLDGSLRSVRGVLPAALLAKRIGLTEILVPAACAREAQAAGITVYGAGTLREAVAVIRGDSPPAPPPLSAGGGSDAASPGPDLSDVSGQAQARRALEVAAAGGHHLLMVGPPGCGKTMLARRLPGILPPLTIDEAIEVTCIYSAAGLSGEGGLILKRPFRAPHHTISGVGLVGGGRGPRPGEITLAHHGVLFLDEMPEFGRATLDVLRQPLEEGVVYITRDSRTLRMPARFTLVGAMNPCVCGNLGRSERPCACTPAMVAHYRSRVSGPLLDRFDVQIALQPVRSEELRPGAGCEPSAAVAQRVAAARRRQSGRLGSEGSGLNRHLPSAWLRRNLRLEGAGARLLQRAVARLGFSARAHDATLRVAQTIADLEERDEVGEAQIAEAIQYRHLDKGREKRFSTA